MMQVWAITDIGLVRRQNQDAYGSVHKDEQTIAVVCDGMGGSKGGEVASKLAVDRFLSTVASALRAGMTPEQIRERDERVMKKTGGLLDVSPSGPEVLLVDARAVPGTAADQVVEVFGRAAKMRVRAAKIARGPETALAMAQKQLAENGALMVVLVADEKTAPALAVYPEERVAVVNADRLGEGVPAPAKEVRIIKELWRGLGMIGGAGYSTQDNCVMQPVFSLKELDETKFQVMQPINYPKMYKMFNKFGVKRARRIPYRLAVREGWANAPTNDYQKAIWDEEMAKKKEAANK